MAVCRNTAKLSMYSQRGRKINSESLPRRCSRRRWCMPVSLSTCMARGED